MFHDRCAIQSGVEFENSSGMIPTGTGQCRIVCPKNKVRDYALMGSFIEAKLFNPVGFIQFPNSHIAIPIAGGQK